MGSQTSLSPPGYGSPYSNASQPEGSWSSDCYTYTQTPDSYEIQYASTEGSPQVLEDAAVSIVDHATFEDTDSTGGHPRPLDTFYIAMHPIRGMFAIVNKYDGTVIRVYGPALPPNLPNHLNPNFLLLSQEDSRVPVPQPPYICGNTQKDWDQKPTILFFNRDCLGMNLTDAAKKEFRGMNCRDDCPFDEKRGITIRIHFPGYPSSTDVERRLKQLAKLRGDGNPKARSMQLSTKNYKVQAEPVTKSKLVQEVAKRIEWHIADLETHGDLFPFNDNFDEKWRLGQGKMKFEHMVITGLVNVSNGSWSPVIFVE